MEATHLQGKPMNRSLATSSLWILAATAVLVVALVPFDPVISQRAQGLPGAIVAFNFLASIIRAIGDSRTPLIFLTISCLLNAGLVILMVGPLAWGIAGAALATVVAQAVSVRRISSGRLSCSLYTGITTETFFTGG